MDLEKRPETSIVPKEEVDELKKQVEVLQEAVEHLHIELQEAKLNQPKPVITSDMVGQIGGMILGALAIIGIFWL
ncbi:hypothetical protein [Priestia koreensis]|uniref:Uncharacterized protein n=1 Tax=Priestia koreensis TaxID=284581 RepID=A0A0M0L9C2_9BACI|nr:hypothetical protein [Priestia koreensis]KOO47634.1 hypothetical protein AMD01_06255 [Priestia koreensis]